MLRFGVLGAARIATQKVIPAMQRSEHTRVTAIASRDATKAREAADRLGIAKHYGSYAELLADPEIDAIYNPLPNHLHVPLSIEAAAAGKHVLCEKPIALTAAEARKLIDARDRHSVVIAEAFMVKTHPQWVRVKQIADSGEIGQLRQILGGFSYFNRDAANIRNVEEFGGGALMDIGCYPVFLSRWIFGHEPTQAIALIDRDPDFKTDRLTSAILDFGHAHAVFSCSTQTNPYQRMQIIGSTGRIEVEIPFNAPPDRPTRIFIDQGGALDGSGVRVEEFAAVDQYLLQGDAFARAVCDGVPPPVTLEESVANMQAIEALFRSVSWGRWESPGDVPCDTCLDSLADGSS
jgi:predicted dehydrogenase